MKPLCLFYLRSRALQRLALCLGKAKVNIFMMIFFILQRNAFVWQISFSRLMLAFRSHFSQLVTVLPYLLPAFLSICGFSYNFLFFISLCTTQIVLDYLKEGRNIKNINFQYTAFLLYCIISRAHRSGTGTLHTMSLKKRPVADG